MVGTIAISKGIENWTIWNLILRKVLIWIVLGFELSDFRSWMYLTAEIWKHLRAELDWPGLWMSVKMVLFLDHFVWKRVWKPYFQQAHDFPELKYWAWMVFRTPLSYQKFLLLFILKILNLYIILLCTHLYHFFPVSIHYLKWIHCLFHYMWWDI